MRNNRWTVKPVAEDTVATLRAALPNVSPAICRMLAVRAITGFDQARDFFRPTLDQLHDPFLMKDMDKAVARISEAVEWHERILVYGDYDVDGTTAVSVVYSFLKEHYDGPLAFYIPHRYREGYGLSRQGVDYAHANGYHLIVTLDCGIKSVELVNYAQSLGIDVIICDHHLPDEQLPQAKAILNPKQPACPYPYKELSGCGIGFKLVSALAMRWKKDLSGVYAFLDLVATSIAADIVPIDGENRILAYYGIKKVNEDPSLPIRTLIEIAGIRRRMHVSDLVFVIGPRVNAAGRMDDARKAVEFFIEKDPARCRELAEVLHADNFDRKEVDRSITQEALGMMLQDRQAQRKKSTVLYQPHWHKGVVGIVASRLIDHYYRPTIVLTASNGKVSGSARSVRGFNIYEALHACRDLLVNYGGHFYAAGMTMEEHVVAEFIDRFESVVAASITEELLVPEIQIDAEILFSDIRPAFYRIIAQFEPFGPANPKPVFLTRNVRDFRGNSRVVKEQHLKFVVQQTESETIDGIGFGLGEKAHLLNRPFDMVYTIDENEFNGVTRLQLKVLDIRPAAGSYYS